MNYGTDAQVAAEACGRMHFSGDETATGVTISTPLGTDVGDPATVTISATYQSLTGFLDGVFGNKKISSTVEVRLEQVPNSGLGTETTNFCS